MRWFTEADAPSMRALLNEPAWIQNIYDAEVRSDEQAAEWIRSRLLARYWSLGYGFWAVEGLDNGEFLGLCGVIKREGLDHPDIGYGFLSRHWGHGYAREAATATFAYCREVLGMQHILGTTGPENHASGRVLLAIGLEDQGVQQTLAHEGLSRVYEWREDRPAGDAAEIAALRLRWHAALTREDALPTFSACVTPDVVARWVTGREDFSEQAYRALVRRHAPLADDTHLPAVPTPLGWRLDLPLE
ncbi:GNAT family N-acetyltransferase [Roseateles sp. YR242]|uniref:GNAT family N-acetyltransferase n=1 Tax=Roseateles sp. YR242 TaxID=1855305 RepID=UPI0015A6D5EA|nr:GNAT family N-acetyltransferase [Roseateles sp. YR242]